MADKYTGFLSFVETPVLMAENALQDSETYEQDKKELRQNFFSVVAECELGGVNVESAVKKAYKTLCQDIIAYRKAAKRDEEFEQIALAAGYNFPHAKDKQNECMLSLATVGLVFSDNPRDLKFMLKTLRAFLRSNLKHRGCPANVVSRFLTAPSHYIQQLRNIEFASLLSGMAIVHAAISEQGNYGATPQPFSFGISWGEEVPDKQSYSDILKSGKKELRSAKEHNLIALIIILGMQASHWFSELFEISDITIDEISALSQNVIADTSRIADFAEFQMELYYNAAAVFATFDRPIEKLTHDLVQVTAGPLIERVRMLDVIATKAAEVAEEEKAKANKAQQELAEAEFAAQTAELVEQLENQVAAQNNQIADLTAQIARLKDQLAQSKEQEQIATEKLEISRLANRNLNDQLLAVFNDSYAFVEEEEEEKETAAVASGLKARLGEKVYQFLSQKKVFVVGGHANAHTRIFEVFPHWGASAIDTTVDFGGGKSSYDLIVVVSGYCTHPQNYAAKKASRTYNVPMVLCSKNSAHGICSRAYETLAIQ